MAAGFYHVALAAGSKTLLINGKDKMIVSAESGAEALLAAKAYTTHPSDAAWAAATATLLAQTTDLAGWRLRLQLHDAAAALAVDVTVTAVTVGDFDSIGALAVIALNAHALIANSAYATPVLTVSSIADGIGDHTLTATYLPPVTWDDYTIPFPSMISTIKDGGIAGATVELTLLDVVAPAVMYEVN